MSNIENVGGRQTRFGPVASSGKFGGKTSSDGPVKTVEYDISFDSLPDADNGNEMVIAIPAGSLVESSVLKVEDAWVGGTNLQVGLKQKDGTVIDADGLHAAILTAALTAGAIDVGAGALVGASSGANDAVVAVTATGSYTAGSAKLIVSYVPFGADAA